jgi:hypothetical protein
MNFKNRYVVRAGTDNRASVESTFKCQIMKGIGTILKSNYSIIIIDAD